jgi:hypothetical protein
MTGPEDFLRGLDDPEGTPARLPAIDGVVSRGNQLRARRYAAVAASAAGVTAVIAVAAFGALPHLSADRSGTDVGPATQPPASATATASPHASGDKQVVVIAPRGGVTHRPHAARPTPVTAPVVDPCATASAPVVDPSATAEPTPPAENGTTATCTSPSPSATAQPSSTASPVADSPSPSESAPAAIAPQ